MLSLEARASLALCTSSLMPPNNQSVCRPETVSRSHVGPAGRIHNDNWTREQRTSIVTVALKNRERMARYCGGQEQRKGGKMVGSGSGGHTNLGQLWMSWVTACPQHRGYAFAYCTTDSNAWAWVGEQHTHLRPRHWCEPARVHRHALLAFPPSALLTAPRDWA